MTQNCVNIDQVRAYNLGTLGWEAAEGFERHVATCADCQGTLETLDSSADLLVLGLRGAAARGAVLAAGAVPGGAAIEAVKIDSRVARLAARLCEAGSTRWMRAGDTSRDDGRFDLATGQHLESGRGSTREEWSIDSRPATGPIPESAEDLSECLLQGGILSEDELSAATVAAPRWALEDALSFARWLVERQLLTCYQAAESCLGRSAGLLPRGNLLLEEIGRGGMGRVYLARNVRMQRLVAVKFLAPHLFAHSDTRERFHRETRAIASLSHPHVLTAYDAGEYSGGEYLIMEYVTGCDLGHLVRQTGPIPWPRAVHYIRQAAMGLAAAHDQGIVHRDVKPSNLMVFLDGTVKVADLGLARFLTSPESQGNLTGDGQIMGTLDYIAPEQAFQGESTDIRSDIYSLGWTLFHLLTGEVPYRDASGLGKLQAHRDGPIPRLVDWGLELPEQLRHCFERMVAKRPQERPQTMGEVVADLKGLLTDGNDMSLPPQIARRRPPDPEAFFRDLAIRRQAFRHAQRESAPPTLKAPSTGSGRWIWVATALAACGVAAVVASGFLVRQFPRPDEPTTVPSARRVAQGAAAPPIEDPVVEVPNSKAPNIETPPPAATDAAESSVAEDVPSQPPEAAPARNDLFGQIGQIQIPQRVAAIALSPDRSIIYAASSDSSVYAIDAIGKRVLQRLVGHRGPVGALDVSLDGKTLVTCSGDRTIRVWNLDSSETTAEIRLPVTPYRVAMSPDGRSVLAALMVNAPVVNRPGMSAAQRDFRSLMLLDAETGEVVGRITDDRETFYWSVAFSPGGEWIAAGSEDGRIDLIEVATEKVFKQIANRPGPTHCLRFSGDGERLYAGNAIFATGFDIPDGQIVYRYGMRHATIGIDVNQDETRLLAAGTIDVRVIDAELIGPEALTNLHGHTSPISGLLFLADETRAVSAGWDGTIRIWKLPAPR